MGKEMEQAMGSILSVAAADEILATLGGPLDAQVESEWVDLLDLVGQGDRILSQPITSPLDFPHWDNSAMDGYGVRYDDVVGCSVEHPAVLKIVEEIAAGQVPKQAIAPGQAARIFTGAMLPEGADTIVIQENTRREGERVVILEPPGAIREFVREQGAFHRAGDLLLPAGVCIGPADLAVLAAAQCAQVQVYRRLQVGILSTGDELVAPDQPLGPGQIVDSNRYALGALVHQSGALPRMLETLPDRPELLKTAIQGALAQVDLDVVLSSGGVSVGDHDHVDQVLEALGATLQIRAIAVKPGKPLTVATIPRDSGRSLLYFGLPGNPVSALVSFWRFVQPTLLRLSGRRDWQPRFVTAIADQTLKGGGQRETYLWGNLTWTEDRGRFAIAGGSHSSGNLVNLAQTNALAKLPIGVKTIPAGSPVEVLLRQR